MPNDWKIKKGDVDGGQTGQLLDGCEIRINQEGTGYEFLAVLAKTNGSELPKEPFDFPPFAYRGLIWRIQVDRFESSGEQVVGAWGNNFQGKSSLPGDESGTYTAQSGPGAEEGEEDAASASA
ncbi:MAG TPA: hypothetical protein VHH35_10480 [Pyrinomonadaceae bacterium]|nr:hypothetical protein [Pyrinomonadaceae bacterium]